MDVFKAIHERRSVGRVKDTIVDRSLIEKILEAGIWAPNHHRTEPWHFFVMTGEGRRALGDVFADIAKEAMDDPTSPENVKKLERMTEKPFRAPVVIGVAAKPSNLDRVIEIEELSAVHAAVQNMLLATHALGLGAIWRTGKRCYDQKVKDLFGLEEKDHIVGSLYIGYPDIVMKTPNKTAVKEKTKWIDS
jgi:nitroreductase